MKAEQNEHWESVYRSKDALEVSWFRPHLEVSLRLLERVGLNPRSRVIDIGGGASTLVDDLLDRGILRPTVLDLSQQALQVAQDRLGQRAAAVDWMVANVTAADLPEAAFDLWHDRAALHFLITPEATAAYVRQASRALANGGHAVIAGFASDGPERCSGLPVARREPADIAALFGAEFEMIEQARETHATPRGAPQHFAYAVLRKRS
jgi:ubiquinone/menaquinone biosynthesis C-methylase UbiE